MQAIYVKSATLFKYSESFHFLIFPNKQKLITFRERTEHEVIKMKVEHFLLRQITSELAMKYR